MSSSEQTSVETDRTTVHAAATKTVSSGGGSSGSGLPNHYEFTTEQAQTSCCYMSVRTSVGKFRVFTVVIRFRYNQIARLEGSSFTLVYGRVSVQRKTEMGRQATSGLYRTRWVCGVWLGCIYRPENRESRGV